MEVMYKRCGGLDVHQATVVACVRLPGKGRRRTSAVRTCETTIVLLALAHGLTEQGVTHVAMEHAGGLLATRVQHPGGALHRHSGQCPTRPDGS